MKATEHYFPVLLQSTLLYKVSLMFKPIEEILESESYWAVIFCGTMKCGVLSFPRSLYTLEKLAEKRDGSHYCFSYKYREIN